MNNFSLRVFVRRLWLVCLIALLFSSLAACDGKDGASDPVQNEIKSGDILYEDDFSKVPSGWGVWENDEAVIAYDQGGLRIQVNKSEFDYWSVARERFEDSVIEVDAIRVSGSVDNDFGIICRYQDAKNFYMLFISSDGYYGIGKLKDDQHSLIGIDQLQYSDKIQPQTAGHRLRADCVGDTLRLFVDGNLLMETSDSDFSDGNVGVLAGAYSTPGVEILFDNFKVRQP